MKYKITFTIGTGFDAQNNPIKNTDELRLKTFKLLAQTYGGYTAIDTLGRWIDGGGNLIEENSLKIECLYETSSDITEVKRQAQLVAFTLCSLWNQNCIVCEVVSASFDFITQEI